MRSEFAAAQKFLQFHTYPGDRLLCAVSGGLDSMCLLDFVLRLAEGMALKREVCAAHFNHHLRGEAADRDEAFVRGYCSERGIPLTVGQGDVRGLAAREGLSLEEAARKARGEFLENTTREQNCRWILTAHHAGDNAETVLLNLIRGTGLKGLCGIPPKRDPYLRPFLTLSREDLAEYAAARNIPHIEDETNGDPEAASRNALRLQVMPLLRELNPKAVEHINAAAGRISQADRLLDREAADRLAHVEVQNGRAALLWEELALAPAAVRPRMLLRLFDLLGVGRRDIGAVHLNAILAMASHTEQGRESRLSLPHGVTARYCRRWLILETRPQPLTEVQLLPGQPLRWGDYTLTLLDRREGEGIALRDRRPEESRAVTVGPCPAGDRLTLPGARGSRTVKRLCLDHRVTLEERDRLPAVYAGGHLAAVWRLGVDQAFLPEEGKPVRFIQVAKLEKEGERP